VNSVGRAGRAACIGCNSCVGFPCPADAKNGTQNTMLPRALATGNCELVTDAMVAKVTTDAEGRVTGVSVFVDGATHAVAAREVVLGGLGIGP
jgi:choline dehydrogenase-like flavoprotein